MSLITNAEYILMRHFILFIAYKKCWSIVRVAEWLLARKYEQYTTAYEKHDNYGFREINDAAEKIDIATNYILTRTLDIGHSALYLEGEKEKNRRFYQAYYRTDDINHCHIVKKLNIDFNQLYDFSYSVDVNGYVIAFDNTGAQVLPVTTNTQASPMMGNPSVTQTEPKSDKERIAELEAENDKLRTQLEQQAIEVKSTDTQPKNQDSKIVVYLAFILAQKLPKYRKTNLNINAKQVGEAITAMAQELGLDKDDMHGFKRPDARLRTLINDNKELLSHFESLIKDNKKN
jgi:hypothetical protein